MRTLQGDDSFVTAAAEVANGTDSAEQIRAHVYSLLARLLAEPVSGQLLDLLRGFAISPEATGSLVATWEMLRLAAQYTSEETLDDEFHDLFVGITRGELVPYGSWYLTGSMMDRPLAYLRHDLDMLGIERRPGVCEPEDHVAALCEAMAVIITSTENLSHEVQKEFFDRHIAPWMDLFFKDLQEAKSANFYHAVGRLGEQFIGLEKRYFAMPG